MNQNDNDLFLLLKNGDEKAFELLFKKHYASLCRYAFSYLKDKTDSEEVVQEVFIRIWDNREKIDIHTAVNFYLLRSVKNQAFNLIKKKSRHFFEPVENIPEQGVHDTEEYMDEAKLYEFEKKYEEALATLPERCREIFMKSRIEKLKYREIADQFNISVKTVETQMSIALKRLRDLLSPYL